MTTAHDIDWPQVLAERLTTTHPDVLRELLTTFIHTLMGAEADALCGAGYGQRSAERTNQRNGYRPRQFDTRAGSLDLATAPSSAVVKSTPRISRLARGLRARGVHARVCAWPTSRAQWGRGVRGRWRTAIIGSDETCWDCIVSPDQLRAVIGSVLHRSVGALETIDVIDPREVS
jgi:hypothetical protein